LGALVKDVMSLSRQISFLGTLSRRQNRKVGREQGTEKWYTKNGMKMVFFSATENTEYHGNFTSVLSVAKRPI